MLILLKIIINGLNGALDDGAQLCRHQSVHRRKERSAISLGEPVRLGVQAEHFSDLQVPVVREHALHPVELRLLHLLEGGQRHWQLGHGR